MAVTDAYATVEEYRSRTDSNSDSDDAEITVQLVAASRLIDNACNTFFTKDVSPVERILSGPVGVPFRLSQRDISYVPEFIVGASRLYLPVGIASTTGLVVKVDTSGAPSATPTWQTLTKDTHFWLCPENAGYGPEPEPYTYLDVIPDNGVFDVWPSQRRAVSITARWGWPQVPLAVKEATIMLARQIRDLQEAGPLLTLQNLDGQVRLSPDLNRLIKQITSSYGRTRKPFV